MDTRIRNEAILNIAQHVHRGITLKDGNELRN